VNQQASIGIAAASISARDDGHFTINVDSRMKAPNMTIADLTQCCFSAMGLIRWRCDRPTEEKHIDWAARFQDVAERHIDEAIDARSMHD
jgi:hypothetical protein